MTQVEFNFLRDHYENNSYRFLEEISFHDDYSGRGMFGDMTHAISGSRRDLDSLLVLAAEYDEEEVLYHMVRDRRIDSMGMGEVWY